MTEAVKLSICMPTYNFGAFIAATLDSIVPQLVPGVEIVILDGGSTDNTSEAVRPFLESGRPISYVRQDTRGGIDRDMARTIDFARGSYCWLFSSDDIMRAGAIARVLAEIESGFDIYVCGLTLCDRDMNVLAEHRVSRAPWGATFDLRNTAERRRYFTLAETTTAFFSFMGSIILRRQCWQEQGLDESYVGSCWAHVVRILRMIPSGLTLKYLGESLQLKRGDNDSFMDKGLVHRYSIAIDGYHRIAHDVFGDDSFESRQMRRVIVNEYPAKAFFFAKVICVREGRVRDIAELDRLAAKAYRDRVLRNRIHYAAYRLIPVKLYEILRRIYKAARKSVPAAGRH